MKPMFAVKKCFETLAEHFSAESEHHKTMSAGWNEDSEQHNSCNDHADRCSKLAAKCKSIAAKCDKAEDIADLEKLFGDDSDRMMPSDVSIVAPDAPARGRLVLRAGQREVPADAVPVEFRKLVSIEDGTESETA